MSAERVFHRGKDYTVQPEFKIAWIIIKNNLHPLSWCSYPANGLATQTSESLISHQLKPKVSVTPSAISAEGKNQATAASPAFAWTGAEVTAGVGGSFFSAAHAAGVRVCIISTGVVGMRWMMSVR